VFTAGVSAFVADAALGGAIHTTLPPKAYVATSQLSMDFLRPAYVESGTLIGRGKLIQVSRAQGLSETTIEDSQGHMLAHGTSRCVLLTVPFDPPEAPTSYPPFELADGADPDPYQRPVEGEPLDRQTWNTKSGLEIMQGWLAGDLPTPPVVNLTGCRLLEVERGWVVNAMPATEWFCTGARGFYGGAIAVQADLAMGGALMTMLPGRTAFATLDLKVNYLRPVNPDGRELTGTARVVHSGKKVAVMTAEITDADGKWVAVASSSAMILPDRSWAPEAELSPMDDTASVLEDDEG
jgi:uncharacterized protein (TIGR00369 family)